MSLLGLIWWSLKDTPSPSDSLIRTTSDGQRLEGASQSVEAQAYHGRAPLVSAVLETVPDVAAQPQTLEAAPQKPIYNPWCNPDSKSLTADELAQLDALISTYNTDVTLAQSNLMLRIQELAAAMVQAGRYTVRATGESSAIVQTPGVQQVDFAVQGPSAKVGTVLVEHENDPVCVQLHQDMETSFSAGMNAIQNFISVNAR
jgi:uncharacterized lipoprotein NlpE involved in copper resistance